MVVLAALVVPAAAASEATAVPSARSVTLTPAPGTGHGVIGNTTPAEESASLDYSPGLGAACPVPPGQVTASVYRYGSVFRGNGVVGLPATVCIGRFATPKIKVTITLPSGPTIAIRDQPNPPDPTGAEGTEVTVMILPSPPGTRYRISDEHGLVAQGAITGDGGGAYTVHATAGSATASTTFVLDPAPSPRLTNLTSMEPSVAPGRRLQFGAAGEQPLSTFPVAVFGPYVAGAAWPLRTMIVARADKHGEATITLDALASVPTGSFVAVLDPNTALADALALDPRVAMFDVKSPKDS